MKSILTATVAALALTAASIAVSGEALAKENHYALEPLARRTGRKSGR